MSLQSVEQLSFGFLPSLPIKIEISPALLSSDAGLLPVREFDERIGLTAQFAKALSDERHPSWMEQSNLVMVRQRIYGIIADYEDQNDHDTLRSDPVFKLIADRLPEDGDLASQPTLSRFENAVTIADLWRLRDTLVDQFIQSFDEPPLHLTLDMDPFDDPTHGQQQLTMYHGYYEQHQYLPIVFTCAENDAVLLVGLRHGTGAIPFRRRVADGSFKERTRLRRRDLNRRISCEIGSYPRMADFAGRRWSWETIAWMDRIRRAFDHRKKWLVGFRPN